MSPTHERPNGGHAGIEAVRTGSYAPSASPRSDEHWHTACTPQNTCASCSQVRPAPDRFREDDEPVSMDAHVTLAPPFFAQADVSRPCFRHAPWPDGSPPPFSACARAGVDPKPTGRSFWTWRCSRTRRPLRPCFFSAVLALLSAVAMLLAPLLSPSHSCVSLRVFAVCPQVWTLSRRACFSQRRGAGRGRTRLGRAHRPP